MQHQCPERIKYFGKFIDIYAFGNFPSIAAIVYFIHLFFLIYFYLSFNYLFIYFNSLFIYISENTHFSGRSRIKGGACDHMSSPYPCKAIATQYGEKIGIGGNLCLSEYNCIYICTWWPYKKIIFLICHCDISFPGHEGNDHNDLTKVGICTNMVTIEKTC